jgi:transcriptional regulator GlxA family with amidase domain
VSWVAGRCGFGTTAGLRLHFQRELGSSPLAYRHAFRRPQGVGAELVATQGPRT